MTQPDLTVLVVTYDRPYEIRETLNALRGHLRYDPNVKWHLADDGSPGSYLDDIYRDFADLDWAWTVTPRLGWGANVNTALRAISTDYIFLIEDDYVARHPLDLYSGVALLTARSDLDLVRYDGLAGHVGLSLWMDEAPVAGGHMPFLRIDTRRSGHLNCYSNRPHLRHRRFHERLGLYPEGLPLGYTEETYAHRVKDVSSPQVSIAVLVDGITQAFDHIGKTRQGTDLDPNRMRV